MRTYSNKVHCRQFAVFRTTTSCSSRTKRHARYSPHCRLPAFQCAWVHWTRKLAAEQSRSKSRGLFSVHGQRRSRWWNVTKFQTLISWNKFWSTPGLSEARTHWTERLISCQKDWRWLSKQRVVMLNFVDCPCFYCISNESWTKLLHHCKIQCNFRGIDDLCKLGKEYLIALTMHFILDKIRKLLTY